MMKKLREFLMAALLMIDSVGVALLAISVIYNKHISFLSVIFIIFLLTISYVLMHLSFVFIESFFEIEEVK